MSFISRFFNQWQNRERELESERKVSWARQKGRLRRDLIESLIADILKIHGVVYEIPVVERLADTVLDRESAPALKLNHDLPLEEFERQRWEIDKNCIDEVIKEYMASDAKEVLNAKANRAKSIQEACKEHEQNRQNNT